MNKIRHFMLSGSDRRTSWIYCPRGGFLYEMREVWNETLKKWVPLERPRLLGSGLTESEADAISELRLQCLAQEVRDESARRDS